jgi:hypothetical protein
LPLQKTQVKARFQADGNTLSIWGLPIDTVHRAGNLKCPSRTQLLPRQLELTQAAAWVAECLDLARGINSRSIVSVGSETTNVDRPSILGLSPERYEMFWRTMLFGHDGILQPVSARYRPMVQRFMEKIQVLHHSGTQRVRFTKMDLNILGTMMGMALGRRFMVTSEGRIGWVTAAAVPGDGIYIFYGGKVLYVLREFGSGRHQFVGDCFVLTSWYSFVKFD